MTGIESELRFNQVFAGGDYILELDLRPYLKPPAPASQLLTVSVNGVVVGRSTVMRRGRFGYRIPSAAFADRQSTSIMFSHPDAVRLRDFGQCRDQHLRSLSLSRLRLSRIRDGASGDRIGGTGGIATPELLRLVNMPLDQFILRFESVGDNCEFGVVQQRCGVEPFLSLLPFGGIRLRDLLRALDNDMRDFGDLANVEVSLHDDARPEFLVREKRYKATFHTSRFKGEIDAERLRASESERLVYCARKFVNSLQRGNKIFVIKRNEPLEEDEILPLYAALSSYGRNTVLWIVPADAEHASGTVEMVLPGLLKGFIARFAQYDRARDLLLNDWLEVCANAYRLGLVEQAPFERPDPHE